MEILEDVYSSKQATGRIFIYSVSNETCESRESSLSLKGSALSMLRPKSCSDGKQHAGSFSTAKDVETLRHSAISYIGMIHRMSWIVGKFPFDSSRNHQSAQYDRDGAARPVCAHRAM